MFNVNCNEVFWYSVNCDSCLCIEFEEILIEKVLRVFIFICNVYI